jgi:acetyl-CoA acetyltransferase
MSSLGSSAMRGLASIVGMGVTDQGKLPGRTADDIAVEAFRKALADAGVQKSDVDGLITCKSYGGQGVDTEVGKMAGLNPRYSASLDYGTCNFSLHLAVMALAAGMANVIAIMYGTNQKTAGNRFAAPLGGEQDFLAPQGFLNVAGPAAMAFRRHQHLYGTREDQLGRIAVAQRAYARLNPLAVFTHPMDLDDYLQERYIVEPLRRPDITMISDGGACLILTRTEQAADLHDTPVRVLGMSQQTGLRDLQNDSHLMRSWIGEVSTRVYQNAGVARDDVDVLYLQDPTSIWVLQMLEWYGFCPVGSAGPFLEEVELGPGGNFPMNTNGGQLSESYMWGWLHLCEAVRQLRGEAGPRQVENAKTAQYSSTMAFKKAAATILGVA